MKKFFKTLLIMLMVIASVLPTTAYAEELGEAEMGNVAEWVDIELTDEEFNDILAQNPNNAAQPYATGLIMGYSIGVTKNGNTIKIAGKTSCIVDVVKCGFSKVVVQRRANSSSSWSNYVTYVDIYENGSFCLISKSLTVPSGYQYRATCVHYAKKNAVTTQKINNTSNTVTV